MIFVVNIICLLFVLLRLCRITIKAVLVKGRIHTKVPKLHSKIILIFGDFLLDESQSNLNLLCSIDLFQFRTPFEMSFEENY